MWYMNEEREMLKNMMSEFVANEVKPLVKDMENDIYPKEVFKKLGDLGFGGLCQEEKYGGMGVDWINFGIALEEIAKESNTLALLTSLNYDFTINAIKELCTPEQVERFIKPAIRGDIILGYWTTEPVGVFNMPEYETRAEKDGDEWVINGGKIFATNAGIADYAFISAKTSDFDPSTMQGLSWFLIPKDAEGFQVGRPEHKLGWKGTETCQVYFDNVRLSDEYRVGPVGGIAPTMINNLSEGYSLYGVMTLGSATSVWERTREFLSERIQNGKSLWDAHQVVRNDMAKMWIEIENFRHSVYSVLENRTRGENVIMDSIALKVQGCKLLESVASQCIVLHGGTGSVIETDIERFYRDAKMCYLGCGSNNILTDFLTKYL